MKAVVMAGGEGTRLRPLTCNRPKPMVPVVNKPIIQHIFELLKRHEITDIAVTLYYLADEIESFFGDGAELGLHLSYSVEDVPLGTAGSVKKAAEVFGRERVLVISGDALTDIDLQEAVRFHEARSAVATIVTTRVDNPLEYGIVVTDDEGRIRRFLEKPSWGEVFSDTVNTGIYILEPEVLDYIDPGKPTDFSQDVFPALLRDGKRLYAHVASGYWCDVGNIQQYRQAQVDAVMGRVKVEIPGNKIGADIWVGEGTEIAANACLSGPLVIGRNCRIGPGAGCFEYTFMGDNCIIEKDAVIQRSILWQDTFVGQGAEVRGAVIGQHAIIKDFVTCHDGVVVGDRCRIEQGAILQPQIKVWPNKVIEPGSRVTMSLIWGTKWPGSIFKDRGVAGLTNIELTPEFAMKLGASFGSSIGKGATVTTSRDDHPASRMILRSIICGLMTVGVNIFDLRSTPLPVSRYNIKTLGVDGGVHIRVSPDNPRLTLIELFGSQGINLPRAHERKIENIFFREDFRRTDADEVGKLEFPGRVLEPYTEAFFNYVDARAIAHSRLSVVVDYAYSRLSMFLPSIFGRLGCDMVALNAYPDHSRAPKTRDDREAHLRKLSETVSTLKADMGVFVESDGERLALVDEMGRVVEGNTLLAAVVWLATRDAFGMCDGLATHDGLGTHDGPGTHDGFGRSAAAPVPGGGAAAIHASASGATLGSTFADASTSTSTPTPTSIPTSASASGSASGSVSVGASTSPSLSISAPTSGPASASASAAAPAPTRAPGSSTSASGGRLLVVATVAATSAVDRIAAENGARIVRTRQDARSLMEFASRAGQDILFAGDTEGGFIFPRFQPAFDAMFSLAKVFEFLARQGVELSHVVDSLAIPPMVRRSVSCPWEHKGRVMRVLAEETADMRREFIDGLRLFFDDGWLLVLPDPAEPFVHIYSEAVAEDAAAGRAQEYADRVAAIVGI
ncbi:MAG: NTP transferase domain-containing protein [Firmicutes bacterium]|nr:NTP transferase domain-containing protein [Bacillota bacterium]